MSQNETSNLIAFGDQAFLVQFESKLSAKINLRVHRLLELLRSDRATGISSLIPAFCSLTVCFDKTLIEPAKVNAWISGWLQSGEFQDAEPSQDHSNRVIDIPVCYAPEFAFDIETLEEETKTSWDTIVQLHSQRSYRVMMSGFLPGFGYMGMLPNSIQVQRHASPRRQVPAGSVGIADSLTGIYPVDAPGGWKIIGRTPQSVFSQDGRPFLLTQGDQVRFRSISKSEFHRLSVERCELTTDANVGNEPDLQLEFLMPGMQTSVQDICPRFHQEDGVPTSGPMDRGSAILANQLVGNSDNAPVFEITLMGPVVRFSSNAVISITGADMSPTIHRGTGSKLPVAMHETVSVRGGDTLRFGRRKSGCRSYLAVAGTFMIPTWLNSCSATFPFAVQSLRHSVIRKGQIVGIDQSPTCDFQPTSSFRLGQTSSIRIHPGPEFDLFTDAHRNAMVDSPFQLAVDSNRMGYRLGPSILDEQQPKKDFVWRQGIISSAVFPGVIQMPPSGSPILLMRDCQTTGGYARIAVVDSDDLDQLAQRCPGEEVCFEWVE